MNEAIKDEIYFLHRKFQIPYGQVAMNFVLLPISQ